MRNAILTRVGFSLVSSVFANLARTKRACYSRTSHARADVFIFYFLFINKYQISILILIFKLLVLF